MTGNVQLYLSEVGRARGDSLTGYGAHTVGVWMGQVGDNLGKALDQFTAFASSREC